MILQIMLAICCLVKGSFAFPLNSSTASQCSQETNQTNSGHFQLPVAIRSESYATAASRLYNPIPTLSNYTPCTSTVARIIQTQTSQAAICPWHYECDYDGSRVPRYMFHAKCTNRSQHLTSKGNKAYVCKEIYQKVKVIKFTRPHMCKEEKQWEMQDQLISVACTYLEQING